MTLTQVKRAAGTKDRADHRYRQALQAAHDAGHSYADIARAAGVSRQAVRQLLNRATGQPMTADEFAHERASDMRVPATRAAYEKYLREYGKPSAV